MKISQIKTEKPFEGLFPIDLKILRAVQDDMAENGYDRSQPIVLWERGQNDYVMLDGHTRLIAARNLGIEDIPEYYQDFDDEEKALSYAIHNQRDRRNLTDAQILDLVKLIDQRKPRGGDRKSEKAQTKSKSEDSPIDISSAKKTAETIGISPDKIKETRMVLDHSSDEEKEAIKEGKESIHRVTVKIRNRKKDKEVKVRAKRTNSYDGSGDKLQTIKKLYRQLGEADRQLFYTWVIKQVSRKKK